MMILSRRATVSFLLLALAWIACPGDPFAPLGSVVQEAEKGRTPAQKAQPAARPQPPGEPDEDDEAAMRKALARRSLQENCLIGHTEDMIAGQRLTPVQWRAEIEKMVNWGAPLPKDAEVPLVDHPARHYSDRSTPPVPVRAAPKDVSSLEMPGSDREPASAGGDPAHGAQVYAANCATCHGPTAMGGDLDPAWSARRSRTIPASTTRSCGRASGACPASRL